MQSQREIRRVTTSIDSAGRRLKFTDFVQLFMVALCNRETIYIFML